MTMMSTSRNCQRLTIESHSYISIGSKRYRARFKIPYKFLNGL